MAHTKIPTPGWRRNATKPTPVKSSDDGSLKSPDTEPVESSVVPLRRLHEELSGAPGQGNIPDNNPGNNPRNNPETVQEFTPDFDLKFDQGLGRLTIITIGDAAWVANGFGNREWTNEDFAREFLRWIAREYPDCAGRKIVANDIEVSFLPRFQAATGCVHLALGSLLRGLSNVTQKTERSYTDWTGLQRTTMEYRVPRSRRS
jgi:hypothetical protein